MAAGGDVAGKMAASWGVAAKMAAASRGVPAVDSCSHPECGPGASNFASAMSRQAQSCAIACRSCFSRSAGALLVSGGGGELAPPPVVLPGPVTGAPDAVVTAKASSPPSSSSDRPVAGFLRSAPDVNMGELPCSLSSLLLLRPLVPLPPPLWRLLLPLVLLLFLVLL
ncbi:unnamed protein product [Lampetra planeri]